MMLELMKEEADIYYRLDTSDIQEDRLSQLVKCSRVIAHKNRRTPLINFPIHFHFFLDLCTKLFIKYL